MKNSEYTPKGLEGARRRRKNYYARTKPAKNSRKRWSQYEVLMVLSRAKPDTEMARDLGRSTQAIQNMRCKIHRQNTVLFDLFDDNTINAIKKIME